MVSFFEKLEKIHKTEPNKLQRFFSTRPRPAERVANISREMETLASTGTINTPAFETIKGQLQKLPRAATAQGKK